MGIWAMSTKKTWTTDEVAEMFGKATSRISQLARSEELGRVVQGRVFGRSDIQKLKRYFAENGRNRRG